MEIPYTATLNETSGPIPVTSPEITSIKVKNSTSSQSVKNNGKENYFPSYTNQNSEVKEDWNILGQPIKVSKEVKRTRFIPKRCTEILRENVRTWMEPIGTVSTPGYPINGEGWNHGDPGARNARLPTYCRYSYDSTSRDDFRGRDAGLFGNTRFSARPISNSNPTIMDDENKSGCPADMKEKISFQHQYDSRKTPNYPIAGRRRGAFVCQTINKRNEIERSQVQSPVSEHREHSEVICDKKEKINQPQVEYVDSNKSKSSITKCSANDSTDCLESMPSVDC